VYATEPTTCVGSVLPTETHFEPWSSLRQTPPAETDAYRSSWI
jgi:hypothetical protein